MTYNRYNSGQGYDPTPQEADWLGGMAYNPYSSGTDFGFALRNTLNNLLAHKQAQGQANKEQQRYDEEQAALARKETFERQKEERAAAAEQRRLAVLERPEKPPTEPASIIEAKALMASDPTTYPTLGPALNQVLKIKPEKTLTQIEGEARAKARGTRQGAPLAPKTPTSYEQKKSDIKAAVERGEITQQEGTQLLIGVVKDADDVRKGAAIRQANEKAVADVFNGQNLEKEARRSVRQSGGASPFTTEGYRMDMSRKYSVAQKNITDGVATGEDNQVVSKYDAMHGYFISKIATKYKSFDDWMKNSPNAKRPEFDKDQIKKWFDIYVR
jgi:hypothetical protein